MRNFFCTILFLATFISLSAQDGATALKKAKKALQNYYFDKKDLNKIIEAKTSIDIANQEGIINGNSSALVTLGQIYSELAIIDNNATLLTENYVPKYKNAPQLAFQAYKDVLALSPKAGEKNDALAGFNEIIQSLSTVAISAFSNQNYEVTYDVSLKILEIHDILKSFKKPSVFDDSKELNQQYYITALAAYSNKDLKNAALYYEKAFNNGKKDAEIYDGLYKSLAQSDPAKAEKYLTEGRTVFPNDNNLLFTEINLYLTQNKLDILTDKLKIAMEKEPDNVSVVNTLANVYDQLYQKYQEQNDDSKANEYLKSAEETYNLALEKDPSNAYALYSLGTLHYNKAAILYKDLKALEDDLTAAGLKKADDISTKIMEEFDIALPYFEKSEKSEPNDVNTLIAIKEIYARKNILDKANEYKAKIEKLGK